MHVIAEHWGSKACIFHRFLDTYKVGVYTYKVGVYTYRVGTSGPLFISSICVGVEKGRRLVEAEK